MIVVAIIGILASILLPSLSKAREKAKRAVCSRAGENVFKKFHGLEVTFKKASMVWKSTRQIFHASENLAENLPLNGNFLELFSTRWKIFRCSERGR